MVKIIRSKVTTNWTLMHVATGTVIATGSGKINVSLTAPGEYTLAVTGRLTETIHVY